MEISDRFKVPRQGDQSPLEYLLRRGLEQPSVRPEFYRRFLQETVHVITLDPNFSNGLTTIRRGEKLNLFAFSNGMIPVFTSIERIYDRGIVKQKVNHIQLRGDQLLKSELGLSFSVNPYSEIGKEISKEEVVRILDGSLVAQLEADLGPDKSVLIKLSKPSQVPFELVSELSRVCHKMPNVKCVHLGWWEDPLSGVEPHYIVAVDTTFGFESIKHEVQFACLQVLGRASAFDLRELRELKIIEDYFTQNPQLIYDRES
ncbi:MAG: hypothetical protein RLZZ77_655 [Bacteroidota bacterium]|jgi:hypothetical protein